MAAIDASSCAASSTEEVLGRSFKEAHTLTDVGVATDIAAGAVKEEAPGITEAFDWGVEACTVAVVAFAGEGLGIASLA